MACLDENTLVHFIQGMLSAERAAEVERHVDECPACRELVVAMLKGGPEEASTSLDLGDGSSTDAAEAPSAPSDGPGAAPPSSGRSRSYLPRGSSVGRYVILDTLGAGGMGVVYAAYDPDLNRRLCLKLLRPEMPEKKEEEARLRLVREARAMAQLAHPNVISVFDVGVWEGQVFLAMEYVDGWTLATWVHEPRSWREILRGYLEAGKGLAAAHRVGLVHRDFKPSNVLVGRDGRVQVTDFGLARTADLTQETPEGAVTRPGALVGTPAYMAPELFSGQPGNALADQLSFCVALYEALYDERPFADKSRLTLKPSPKASRVPASLRRTLVRGLSFRPEDRYPSMEALLAALGQDHARWRRRGALAAGALAVVAVGAFAYAQLQARQSPVCKGAERKLAGVWDAGREAAVRQAFAATKVPYAQDAAARVSRTLSDYARAWAAMHVDACEATQVRREQSEALLDLRMLCLDRRLQELGALAELFEHADAPLVEQAAGAAQALAPVSGCGNPQVLSTQWARPQGLQGSGAQQYEELLTRLAHVFALGVSGKYKLALELAQKGAADARALKARAVEAEALVLQGQMALNLDRAQEAEATLYEAVAAGEAGRNDRVVAHAWAVLVFAQGYYQSHFEDAHRSAAMARATLDRLGGDPYLEAWLLDFEGKVFWREGRLQDALAGLQRSLALRERASGSESADAALTRITLGMVLDGQGRNPEALTEFQRALAAQQQALGPGHPVVASTMNNAAWELMVLGRHDEAIGMAREAAVIFERAMGPEHRVLAATLNTLGDALAAAGQHDEALAQLERALGIYRKLSPDGAGLAPYLLAVGREQLRVGPPERAAATLQEAVRLAAAPGRAPAELAEARFALARALWDARRTERARALALAAKAREAFAGPTERDARQRAEIDAWLAERRAGAGGRR